MPYVKEGENLYSAAVAAKITQELQDGYLPVPAVQWRRGMDFISGPRPLPAALSMQA